MGLYIGNTRYCPVIRRVKTLPYDAEIEYIQSSGTQYIDLGKKLDSSKDIIDIKFRLVEQVSATSGFFGARNDASSKNFSVIVASSNNIILDMNDGNYANYRVNSDSTGYNKTCDIQMYQSYKIVYFDLNEAASSSTTSQSFVTDSNAELFRVSNLPMPSVRLQSFKWRQTGTGWIYNMIPVRVGQIGYMYDKIGGTLFGNSGTGNFILGPDII